MSVVDDLKNRVAAFRLLGPKIQQLVAAVQQRYAAAVQAGDDLAVSEWSARLSEGRAIEGDWEQTWSALEQYISGLSAMSVIDAVAEGVPLLARSLTVEQTIHRYGAANWQAATPSRGPMVGLGVGTLALLGVGAVMLLAGRRRRRA